MIKVIVLANTIANWSGFTEFVKDFRESPTRLLDKHNILLESPLALPVALQGLRGSYDAGTGRMDDDLQNHWLICFGVFCDFLTAEKVLGTETLLNKSLIELDRNNAILIISGTMLKWKLAIPLMLSERSSCRPVFTNIYNLFRNSDLRNLWSAYNVSTDKDGYTIMR